MPTQTAKDVARRELRSGERDVRVRDIDYSAVIGNVELGCEKVLHVLDVQRHLAVMPDQQLLIRWLHAHKRICV